MIQIFYKLYYRQQDETTTVYYTVYIIVPHILCSVFVNFNNRI